MKFLPPTKPDTVITRYSGSGQLENYIDNTNIVDNLDKIARRSKSNLTATQKTAMQQLKKVRQAVIIKMADKNLGVVLMNTDDYVTHCLAHLTDNKTYRLITEYPAHDIRQQLLDTLANHKQVLSSHDKRLYKYLCEPTNNTRVPRFYGISKIHREFTKFLPLRPIVSQTLSLLSPSAKFIDHVLQPIARSYPDYLHDSSTLSVTLQDLTVPDNTILVTMDVTSLSIPQEECLQVIYNELHTNRHLLAFDPNLVIKLLHVNMNNTYLTFGGLTFKQISGTAMGVPFSPTIANIYMSVTLSRFLNLKCTMPLLIKRYIDDIFLIRTDSIDNLHTFLKELNSFHSSLRFTHQPRSTSWIWPSTKVTGFTSPTPWIQKRSTSS